MRLIISGHREHKLINYDVEWISEQISILVGELKENYGVSLAYSGMASGVDLYFCEACDIHKLPYIACIPFEGQETTMRGEAILMRESYIKRAKEVKHVKNSWMVENADIAIIVWDGNKGGTHNVLQQVVERKVPFYWINPVSEKVYNCT